MNDETSYSDSASSATKTPGSNTPDGSAAAPGLKPAVVEASQVVKEAVSDVASQSRHSLAKAADQVHRASLQAVDATKAYASDAVDALGRRLQDARAQLEVAKTSANDYIQSDPVRAVKLAAIGGALLGAVLTILTRRER